MPGQVFSARQLFLMELHLCSVMTPVLLCALTMEQDAPPAFAHVTSDYGLCTSEIQISGLNILWSEVWFPGFLSVGLALVCVCAKCSVKLLKNFETSRLSPPGSRKGYNVWTHISISTLINTPCFTGSMGGVGKRCQIETKEQKKKKMQPVYSAMKVVHTNWEPTLE